MQDVVSRIQMASFISCPLWDLISTKSRQLRLKIQTLAIDPAQKLHQQTIDLILRSTRVRKIQYRNQLPSSQHDWLAEPRLEDDSMFEPAEFQDGDVREGAYDDSIYEDSVYDDMSPPDAVNDAGTDAGADTDYDDHSLAFYDVFGEESQLPEHVMECEVPYLEYDYSDNEGDPALSREPVTWDNDSTLGIETDECWLERNSVSLQNVYGELREHNMLCESDSELDPDVTGESVAGDNDYMPGVEAYADEDACWEERNSVSLEDVFGRVSEHTMVYGSDSELDPAVFGESVAGANDHMRGLEAYEDGDAYWMERNVVSRRPVFGNFPDHAVEDEANSPTHALGEPAEWADQYFDSRQSDELDSDSMLDVDGYLCVANGDDAASPQQYGLSFDYMDDSDAQEVHTHSSRGSVEWTHDELDRYAQEQDQRSDLIFCRADSIIAPAFSRQSVAQQSGLSNDDMDDDQAQDVHMYSSRVPMECIDPRLQAG